VLHNNPGFAYRQPILKIKTGANPAIASYNAKVVKNYNANRNLVRFETKNIIIYIEKTL
jgi:hypothetical protein